MSGKVMRTPENRVLKFQNPTIKIKEIDFDTMKSVARTVSGIELSEDVINLIFAIFDDDDSKQRDCVFLVWQLVNLLVQIFGRFVPGRILRHFPRRKIITLVKFLLVFSPIWGGWLLRFTGILRRENQKKSLTGIFSDLGGGWLLRFTGILGAKKSKKSLTGIILG